jgi:hypothetical protein
MGQSLVTTLAAAPFGCSSSLLLFVCQLVRTQHWEFYICLGFLERDVIVLGPEFS